MNTITDVVSGIIDYKSFSRSLQGAHFPITPGRYLQMTILATLFAAVIFILVYSFLFITGMSFVLFPFFPYPVECLFLFGMVTTIVFASLYYYPMLSAYGRKTRIDLDLPYAITYMQALSSTVTLYTIFRNVYEADDLYREVSHECGLIVRDVELFGEDLLTAMRNVQSVTPSESFATLLDDLILVYRSGGSMTDFFASRSASYRELARQEMESLLEMLEMIAEIYVTAFVAGPIAIIIMLVAQNLSGQGQLDGVLPLMYLFLPLGAMALIAILYILLPPDNLEISRSEVKESEFTDSLLGEEEVPEVDKKFIKTVERRRIYLKVLDVIHHPFRFYIANYEVSAYIGLFFTLFLVLQFFSGAFGSIFPEYTYEVFICCVITTMSFPVIVAYEARRYYAKKVEEQLPAFLRELADMNDVGFTLQNAIGMISRTKIGLLSSELKIVSEDMKWGSITSSALTRMEERIGLVSVKRAISLLVKASEVTTYLREVLAIAISDIEHYLKMKSKRLNVSIVYLAVIYLSFGIYLYSAYELNVSFISSFEKFDLTFDISGNVQDMFRIGLILGFFSGIMAGQLSSNSVLAGLKHTVIFLAASVVLFVYIL